MDQFDPYGDEEEGHGTTGRDVLLIFVVIGLIGFVLNRLDGWPG